MPHPGVALGRLLGDIFLGALIGLEAPYGDDADCGVRLPVAAAVEPVLICYSGETGTEATPQSMAKDASDRSHQLGRRLGTDALELNQQPGRRLATRLSTVFGSIRVPCNIRSRTCPSRLYSRRSRA